MIFMTKRLVIPIDGRSIIILINSSAEETVHDTFVQVIIRFCQNEFVAKSFPEITFQLFDDPAAEGSHSEGGLAYANFTKAKEGIAHITIYVSNMLMSFFSDEEVLQKGIYSTLVHEITHILQAFSSNAVFKNIAAVKQLLAKSRELEKNVQGIGVMRYVLRHFFQRIFIEGLAEYSEKFFTGKIFFSENTFNQLLYDANTNVEYFLPYLEKVQKSMMQKIDEETFAKELNQFYESASIGVYGIGEHMVFSILFIDHSQTLPHLLTLELFDFVRLYEKCMEKKKSVPVISFTSGKGVFDYKREVEKLNVFYEFFKKESSN